MNTAMALPGALAACALVFAGCSSQPDAPGEQGDALILIGNSGVRECAAAAGGGACGTGRGGDAGQPGGGSACQWDDDCVAVPLAGCCYNGWKTAVSRADVGVYENARACSRPRPICPMYIVNDTRVAECNRATHKCEMVYIDQIACGGFIYRPHQCPAGYECVYGHVPDIPGRCVADP
jgi:hypothetical protein